MPVASFARMFNAARFQSPDRYMRLEAIADLPAR